MDCYTRRTADAFTFFSGKGGCAAVTRRSQPGPGPPRAISADGQHTCPVQLPLANQGHTQGCPQPTGQKRLRHSSGQVTGCFSNPVAIGPQSNAGRCCIYAHAKGVARARSTAPPPVGQPQRGQSVAGAHASVAVWDTVLSLPIHWVASRFPGFPRLRHAKRPCTGSPHSGGIAAGTGNTP